MGKLAVMGVSEIALRLGVSKSRARQIVAGRNFPAPGATLLMGSIWETADVEKWIAEHRRPKVKDEPAGPTPSSS